MAIGQNRKFILATAAAGALVLTIGSSSSSAQLPGGCPRDGADSVDQAYRFTFDSFHVRVVDRVRGDRWRIVHCLLNRHPTRNLFVDWPDAGIKGWVRAGARGSTVRNAPAVRPILHRDGLLWFGSRPRKRSVTTPVVAGGSVRDSFAFAPRAGLTRAAFQTAPAELPESWTSTASLDVPLADAVRPILARLRPKGVKPGGGALGRLAFKQLVKYIETRPEALFRFEMSFATHVPTGAKASALRYSCTYRAAGNVLLRFDDPELHRAMFGSDALFHAPYTRGPAKVMQSSPVAAAAGVEPRAGRLDILLPDGVTVIGSIGFDYLAPAGS